MNWLEWGFDFILALSLLWIAWESLASRNLFRAIVLYITFGLLMALCWTRLRAFDIALAEAAIGAGLTGALLLSTLSKLSQPVGNSVKKAESDRSR